MSLRFQQHCLNQDWNFTVGEIVKCLKTKLDLEKICLAEKPFQQLGYCDGDIITGEWEHEKEVRK